MNPMPQAIPKTSDPASQMPLLGRWYQSRPSKTKNKAVRITTAMSVVPPKNFMPNLCNYQGKEINVVQGLSGLSDRPDGNAQSYRAHGRVGHDILAVSALLSRSGDARTPAALSRNRKPKRGVANRPGRMT